MPIPDYQSFMLPILEAVADGSERNVMELRAALVKKFGFAQEELSELLPNGRQTVFANRVG